MSNDLELEIDNRLFKIKEPHKPIQTALKDTVDLGFCPVNQTTLKSFDFYNPNAYSVDYQLQCTGISVTPEQGIIGPKSKTNLTLQFTPKEATALTAEILLSI